MKHATQRQVLVAEHTSPRPLTGTWTHLQQVTLVAMSPVRSYDSILSFAAVILCRVIHVFAHHSMTSCLCTLIVCLSLALQRLQCLPCEECAYESSCRLTAGKSGDSLKDGQPAKLHVNLAIWHVIQVPSPTEAPCGDDLFQRHLHPTSSSEWSSLLPGFFVQPACRRSVTIDACHSRCEV